MSLSNALRAKTNILLVLMICFGSVGNVLLSRGMKQIGEVRGWSSSELWRLLVAVFSNPLIWSGIMTLLLFLVCFMVVLSWADYSWVSPASAVVFAVVPLLGHLLFGEVVTTTRWAGVAVICLGVGLVGRTAPSTTREE
jgi:drug/metabolite transporter (DMT)-like permease